jgi:hypothetical protein
MIAYTAGSIVLVARSGMMPPEWRKIGFHFGAVLFGTALGGMLSFPLVAVLAIAMQWTPTRTLLIYVLPKAESALFLGWILVSWIVGLAVTYGLLWWLRGTKAEARSQPFTPK